MVFEKRRVIIEKLDFNEKIEKLIKNTKIVESENDLENALELI
jgi:hypothetical protein